MKRSKTIIALALSSFALLGVTSCGNSSNDVTSSVASATIEFEEKSHEMIFGETYELVAKTSSSESIVWESSDTSVATVSDGSVTAVGKGEATITASVGGAKASCLIKVGFGNILPSLSLDNVFNDEIILARGASFSLKGSVYFNGASYPCSLSAKLEEDSCVSFSGNSILANTPGESYISIKTNWNGFTNSALEKKIKVTVLKDVAIYSEVTLNGQSKVASSLDLGLLDTWEGTNYTTSAKIVFRVNDDGNQTVATIVSPEDGIVSVSEDGVVSAKKAGTTKLYASYTDADGAIYTSFIEITVTCPVATYSEQIRLSMETPFPVERYFGKGATLTYAKQGENELSFTPSGIIKGLEAAGENSKSLLVLTSKGGYYFENTFVYTRALDASNFASTFLLSSGKVVDGYYILDEDINTTIDMTKQISSYYSVGSDKNCYFKGTFDGQGHTVKIKVGREGTFGGLGEQAVIKDTHFEFTFSSSSTYCCGLARNNWTNNIKGWKASVTNLYVTTTNYYDKSYALFETRFNDLTLKDIYVDLTLDETCAEVTSATQEKGALFRVDCTLTHGPSTQFTGDFQNIYVVSGVFMPISSGYLGDALYASYAQNDIDRLGSCDHSNVSSTSGYCAIGSKVDNPQLDLYGNIPSATWFFKATKNVRLAWVYYSSPAINNGGIRRYNTNAELQAEGIAKIGSWATKGE